jgi:hypothetical protein
MAMPSTPRCLAPDPARPNGRDHFTTPVVVNSSTADLCTNEDPPRRAVRTPNFPALLRQLGAPLLVTT